MTENSRKIEYLLETPRCYLRDIDESDATDAYLHWLTDLTAIKYIAYTKKLHTKESLRSYLRDKLSSPNTRFFAIIDKIEQIHIGNIKYEPIAAENGYAVMGVLLGCARFRGKGIFGEVYHATSMYIREMYGIHNVYLGVHPSNDIAIRSYIKAGFVETEVHPFGENHSGKVMLHNLS